MPIRVYFQDTDAGGVVFHATYLAFLERARTEWLRALGFDQGVLTERFGVIFIVRGLEVAFLKPAVLDDLVMVSARAAKVGRAQLTMAQEVRRGDELLLRASVNLACVGRRDFRPSALPAPVLGALAPHIDRPYSVEEA